MSWNMDPNGVVHFLPSSSTVGATERSFENLTVSEEPNNTVHGRKIDSQYTLMHCLPSIESALASTKEECNDADYDLPYISSPDTFSVATDDPFASPLSSVGQSHIIDQLLEFATPMTDTSSFSSSIAYDSISSDDLGGETRSPAPRTPCPRRESLGWTGKRNTYSEKKTRQKKMMSSNTARPSWLSVPINAKAKIKVKKARDRKTGNALSLEKLRDIERVPPHKWKPSQRELLCVLYRFYEPSCSSTIPMLFNSITGLGLRKHVIKAQYESHMRLYGPICFPEFGRVFHSTSLKDPSGRYAGERQIIEDEAEKLALALPKRTIESVSPSGRAAWSRSESTRKNYASLVRKFHEKDDASQRQPMADHQSIQLGGYAIATDSSPDEWETFVDVDEPALVVPNLAFRVWDKGCITKYTEERGFISHLHSLWKGPLIQPLSLEGEGEAALMLLANSHLSMKAGNGSAFVSVATSLLQVMTKALAMEDPRIALIDLGHESLNETNKCLHAKKLYELLKSYGQETYSYKGATEYIIWANLPPAAIINTLHLSKLKELAERDDACAYLLGLQEFKPGRNTEAVKLEFRNRKIHLDAKVAGAMGRLGNLFGMDNPNVTLGLIESFVACVVDGWYIHECLVDDIKTMSTIGSAFALNLGFQTTSYYLQDVRNAFQDGVRMGLKDQARSYARDHR
ncbi:hypothetical protein BDV95DRAFT_610265 [Massariosphaeria phaeospora]|uniref:DUF7587 domain-containing protein n=1 Tax=Massariosphaeria phaeospora TaxID=100035 RepID=A0A7C8I2U2_9PLEO|nr:hypothetical protein BDV95DRAFT_610265 [Massariosphaeria phaeospora]